MPRSACGAEEVWGANQREACLCSKRGVTVTHPVTRAKQCLTQVAPTTLFAALSTTHSPATSQCTAYDVNSNPGGKQQGGVALQLLKVRACAHGAALLACPFQRLQQLAISILTSSASSCGSPCAACSRPCLQLACKQALAARAGAHSVLLNKLRLKLRVHHLAYHYFCDSGLESLRACLTTCNLLSNRSITSLNASKPEGSTQMQAGAAHLCLQKGHRARRARGTGARRAWAQLFHLADKRPIHVFEPGR